MIWNTENCFTAGIMNILRIGVPNDDFYMLSQMYYLQKSREMAR